MTPTPTHRPPLTRAAAEALAAELVAEMTRRWRDGERPPAEEFLARHPELHDHPEAAADLIYEELCLREEFGPDVSAEEVIGRFPQWRPQLELLLDCQRLLGPHAAAPDFPAAGESLGDFLLLAELGRGAHGRVFLASQLSLGDRPVVLKLGPLDAGEHLSLARLQHTNIVPLYSVQDHPARRLRALCMPYFGGATLARLFDALRPLPPARRTGGDLLAALDRSQAAEPLIAPARRQARAALADETYVRAVCRVGACLADALHYAHDRGLVHLDLKPSNVLVTADGQPMVLDFHLARAPIAAAEDGPVWLGGTPGYMSPEQEEALAAVQQGRPVPRAVDGRSDVYSLGVVLYEALASYRPGEVDHEAATIRLDDAGGPELPVERGAGGDRAERGGPRRSAPRRPAPRVPRLRSVNPQVSVGLADVVAKCLAADPAARYPHMAALAGDLRRHLADQPLAGVRNRSLTERWHKWRRRRPHGLAVVGLFLAVLIAAAAVALGAMSHVTDRIDQGRAALADAQAQMAEGDWESAIGTLRRGQAAVHGLPWQSDLAGELDHRLGRAEQGRAAAARTAAARDLHRLADRARFLYGADPLPRDGLPDLAATCRAFWADRGRVVDRVGPASDPAVRADLLDLAIFWADLQVRLASPADAATAHRQALAVLDEAEALCGRSAALDQERRLHGGRPKADSPAAVTAWDHYALGRALLRSGDVDRAAEEVARAVRLQPQGLWPNFYAGRCAARQGRPADAALAYSVAIGAAPDAAACFFGRAAALAALGRTESALADCDQAVRLDPTLEPAAAELRRRLGR